MENQHKLITGYRDLSEGEIAAMNAVKDVASDVELAVDALRLTDADPRWVAIGATHLQEGFMALVRSIAKPTSF
jgi:hypothetical protein